MEFCKFGMNWDSGLFFFLTLLFVLELEMKIHSKTKFRHDFKNRPLLQNDLYTHTHNTDVHTQIHTHTFTVSCKEYSRRWNYSALSYLTWNGKCLCIMNTFPSLPLNKNSQRNASKIIFVFLLLVNWMLGCIDVMLRVDGAPMLLGAWGSRTHWFNPSLMYFCSSSSFPSWITIFFLFKLVLWTLVLVPFTLNCQILINLCHFLW